MKVSFVVAYWKYPNHQKKRKGEKNHYFHKIQLDFALAGP